jgi:hypothetical protein
MRIEKPNLPILRKSRASLFTCIILALFSLGLLTTSKDYLKKPGVIVWDVVCYYNYLPALFKYHTFDFDKILLRPGYIVSPEGFVVEKTSMGMAFLYLPFYLAAWLIVWLFLSLIHISEPTRPY